MPPTSNVSNDANSFMPLLFAAHPELVPNYKRMAAMDGQARTASALEHKFRTWRQDGKKILAEQGGNVDSTNAAPKQGAVTSKKPLSMRGGGPEKKASGKVPRHKSMNKKDINEEEEEDEKSEDDLAADAQVNAEVNLLFSLSRVPMSNGNH